MSHLVARQVTRPTDPDGLVLEAWGEGMMVGCLLIMAAVTIANMRRGVLLHKLILIELIIAMGQGTFIFVHEPVYGWYLSVTAIGLNISWSLHNVIAWMKNKPFLSPKVSAVYISTVLLAQPYWVLEIYANFTYFNNINSIFLKTRPLEPIFRDPWWVFTACSLFLTIKRDYNFGLWELIKTSPRFGVMLAAMILSIAFIIVDTCSVLHVFSDHLPTGIEPFWKLSSIFKCLTDTVILDDFKTALDRLRRYWLQKHSMAGGGISVRLIDTTRIESRSGSGSESNLENGEGVIHGIRAQSTVIPKVYDGRGGGKRPWSAPL